MAVKGIMNQISGYQGIDSSGTTNSTISNSSEGISNVSKKAVIVDLENKNPEAGQRDNSSEYKMLKNAIDEINRRLMPTRTGCEFTYNDKVNRVSIKVINKATEEVIKEIPPEEAYKALEKVMEIAGLIIDKKL